MRDTGPARARDAPDAVHEQLGPRGEVEVDDVVEERNVDTARGDVRHHHDAGLPAPKSTDVELTRSHVHGAVHRGDGHALVFEHGHQQLDVVPRRREHHRLLLLGDNLSEVK